MNVDDQAVFDAVKALLNSGGTAASAFAFDLDELKKLPKLPDEYTEVYVTRRFTGEERRGDGFIGTDSYRVSTRQCAKKSGVFNARELRRRTHVHLEQATVTVDGFESTPIDFEGAEDFGEDNEGYSSGLETWLLTF